MSRSDELLTYARDRVQTAQIPFSLVVRAERRRAISEMAVAAVIASVVVLFLGMSSSPTNAAAPALGTTPKNLAMVSER